MLFFSEEFCDLIFKESPVFITDNLLNSDFIDGYDDLEKVFSLVMKYTKPSGISVVISNISNSQSVIERNILKDILSKDDNVRRTDFLKEFNSFLEDSISDYLKSDFRNNYRKLLGNLRHLKTFNSGEFKNLFSSEFVIEKDLLEALFKNSVELEDLSYFIQAFWDSSVTEDNKLNNIKNIKVEVFNLRLLSDLTENLNKIKSSQRFKDIVAKNIKIKFVESTNRIGFASEIDDKFAIPPISQEMIDILNQYQEIGIESNVPEEVVRLYYKYAE